MTYDEIEKLAAIKRRKKITGRECAKVIGVSGAMISYFFSHQENLTIDKQEKLKQYIENKPVYRTVRILTK
ncbi:MAG: hypothetical protein ABF651_00010 [Sporolactobacillus sp.]